ncbi:MAG: triose-phosphate isomerase [Rickettsiales bacterium]
MKKLLVGNWKMNLNAADAVALSKAIQPSLDYDIVICPSLLHLSIVQSLINTSGIKLGAQNVSRETFGSFTGDVCAEQLKDIGCEYVIIGHSERRVKAEESNVEIHTKLQRALEVGLKPILCVGESLEEYKSELTNEILARQLLNVEYNDSLIIAYEPVWAIGTGLVPTNREIENSITTIKSIVNSPVLYGGSVSAKNSSQLDEISCCDGFLVGGASLKADEFNKIY